MADEYNKRVAFYRNMANMNQSEVAEKLGMKSSTYSQLERKGKIGVDQLVNIAKVLEIDIDLLLYGKPEKTEESKPLDFNPEDIAKPMDLKQPDFMNTSKYKHVLLSKQEENIIKILRIIDKEDREEVIVLIDKKHKKHKFKL